MMRTLKTLLLAAGLCALTCTTSHAQVNFSITVAPPLLPVYEQPPCPEDGYLWTPGYWDYDDGGYYWVPGVWVAPPRVGFLWTPGYWGFNDGFYVFNRGYWGPHVGFYGGVNYGYGYGGYGYGGGRWDHNHFVYNTAVTRVNTTVIHNTYVDNHVNEHVTDSRASFNGRGGVTVQPTAEQRKIASGPHVAPTSVQTEHRQAASRDEGSRAAANGGRPATPALERAAQHGGNDRADRQAARTGEGQHDGQPFEGRPETAGGPKFPGGQGGTSKASREAALANQHQGPQFPGGQGGTSQESRDAALANQRHQGQDPERAQRKAERQQQNVEAQQGRREARQAQQQQQQREAGVQRAEAGQRQAQQQQAQRQQQAERQPQRAERQAAPQRAERQGGGQGERKEEGKPKGQDRQ